MKEQDDKLVDMEFKGGQTVVSDEDDELLIPVPIRKQQEELSKGSGMENKDTRRCTSQSAEAQQLSPQHDTP